jgi:hypothetical protein
MQGVNHANAQARQLLDGCSRTVTVTRLADVGVAEPFAVQRDENALLVISGVSAFRVETGAFPEFHPQGAAAVVLPAPDNDEVPIFFSSTESGSLIISSAMGTKSRQQNALCAAAGYSDSLAKTSLPWINR